MTVTIRIPISPFAGVERPFASLGAVLGHPEEESGHRHGCPQIGRAQLGRAGQAGGALVDVAPAWWTGFGGRLGDGRGPKRRNPWVGRSLKEPSYTKLYQAPSSSHTPSLSEPCLACGGPNSVDPLILGSSSAKEVLRRRNEALNGINSGSIHV